MKRGIFGICLLIGLLALGIAAMLTAKHQLTPIEEDLGQVSQAALHGDWQKTAALTGKARAAWEDCRDLFSCFAQQEEIHEIDRLYDQLEIYAVAGEKRLCSSIAAQLRNLTKELQEDQLLNLPHLL